jgi:hypothetical protein
MRARISERRERSRPTRTNKPRRNKHHGKEEHQGSITGRGAQGGWIPRRRTAKWVQGGSRGSDCGGVESSSPGAKKGSRCSRFWFGLWASSMVAQQASEPNKLFSACYGPGLGSFFFRIIRRRVAAPLILSQLLIWSFDECMSLALVDTECKLRKFSN